MSVRGVELLLLLLLLLPCWQFSIKVMSWSALSYSRQVRVPAVPESVQGTLARVGGRVLWWRAALGRLDAYALATGKLLRDTMGEHGVASTER